MIRIMLAYLAIGGILVTKYSWEVIVRDGEEENLTKPRMIFMGICTCIVAPIFAIIGIIQGLIELIKEN